MTVVVNAHTKNAECYCHVASTLELAVKWIEKYGGNWHDEPYAFLVQEVIIDKDEYCEPFEADKYFNYKGEELTFKEFHDVLGTFEKDEDEKPLWYCQMCGQESCDC